MSHPIIIPQVEQISQGLICLGDRTHRLAEDLCRAGFSAFLPYQEFIESFSTNSRELEIHRRYMKERAKAMMSISHAPYASPLMNQLREAADRSLLRSNPETEWIARLHVDPCEQNAFLLKVRDPQEYENRWKAMLEKRAAQFELETARHSTKIANEFPIGMLVKSPRFKFAVRVLEQELAPLGFKQVRANAARGGVIVSKAIATDWDLDWSIADPDVFYYSPGQGSLALNLKLRASGEAKSDREDVLGKVFSISYPALVYGFSTAYMPFQNLDSLETIIKAHIQLYRLVASDLESIVTKSL